MTSASTLHHAYILHSRPYRETSAILEVFCPEEGRLALVARGARAPKSKTRALLQPFTPLLLSWSGRGELMTLNAAEPGGMPVFASGKPVLTGFYVNELVMRLVPRHDPLPELYLRYEQTLHELAVAEDEERSLRVFELELLEALGYGFALDMDESGQPLQAGQAYRYWPERGLVLSDAAHPDATQVFPAEYLLALHARDFTLPEVRRTAKHLMRRVLATYLGTKPLASRALFLRRG